MEELIPISVTIADRSLRIKVTPAEEETVRKTVRQLNEKVMEFKRNFAGKDMQDYVTMALVWYATQPAQTMQSDILAEDLQTEINRIEVLVDKGLQEIKAKLYNL